ncbi:CPBP family intramembrane glutamic endopeptidase [Salana multivorans]
MAGPLAELRRFVDAALVSPVPHPRAPEANPVRRRLVVVITLLAGASVMGWALRIAPGDRLFYPATLLLAAVWLIGAFGSGPLRLGRARTRAGGAEGRAVVQSLALAALLLAVFLAGALVVARIPALRTGVEELLDHARFGALGIVLVITLLNGIAEEVFFRGALFAALPERRAVPVSAVVYALAVVPTGIPLLVLAAAVLGLVTGLQRRVTGGVLGPIVTHVCWSSGMLFLLPPVLTLGG